MPYDLHTPFGIQPGQVTPAEQLEAQRGSRLSSIHSQLLSQSARDAQMRVLRDSVGGMDNDAFFTPEKQGSGMQSGVKPVTKPGEYGTDAYFNQRDRDRGATAVAGAETESKIAKHQGDMKMRAEMESMLMGGGGEPAAGPMPMKPSAKGPDYSALVGGGSSGQPPATGGGGGMSKDQLMKLQMMIAALNGTAPPNVAEQNATTAQTTIEQQAAVPVLKEAEEAGKEKARERAMARVKMYLDSGDIVSAKRVAAEEGVPLGLQPIEEFVGSESGAALAGGLTKKGKDFYDRDVGDFETDPGETDITDTVKERDRLVTILTNKGYEQADALREANRLLSQQFGGEQNDWEAEWIPKLRAAAGL